MTYTLRPHQARAQNELMQWFYQNPTGNPIVDACVGSGKSVLIADFCRTVLTNWPGQRIIMIVASRELVKQNYERLLSIWPEAPVGVHSAGLRRKDIFESIIFASIGSVGKKAMKLGVFDLALIDECHNINPKEIGLYRQFISDMTVLNPRFRVIGYTGTPYRGNGVWLHKGETALFSGIATRISMREMLDNGYLAPLVLGKTETFIDASGVSMQSGDYNIKQLAKAADRAEITRAAVSEIIAMGTAQNRKSWAIYCVDAKHTQHVYEEFISRGIKVGMITDKTPTGERDKILDDIKHKRIQAVVNCMILTVGWDHPELDLIALMRTTKSPVLYVQICGRGMRTHQNKDDCLWMDFTNTTAMMGPVDQVTGRDPVKPKGAAGAPFKICPACEEENPAGVRYCVKCDFEFPENFPVINPTASDAEILSTAAPVEKKRQVTKIMYYPHQKRNGEANEVSLRVEYICGMQVFKEWVSIQSPSMYARAKAEVWWNVRSDLPIPKTVEEALGIIQTTPFREPHSITLTKNGKYDQVASYEF
jgi:DNA repair protein RadD